MKYPDEILMAYVDNEVDEATRREIDAALGGDPALAARVAQQRAFVGQLQSAYAPIAAEPVPARLLDTALAVGRAEVKIAARGNVISLNAGKRAAPVKANWSWQMLGGIAASLVIGVMLGRTSLPADDGGMVSAQNGQLFAHGVLAAALNTQASAEAGSGPVKVALSYRSKSGAYCRAFMLKEGADAGLACRDQGQWRIQQLTREKAGSATGAPGNPVYRMAGSAIPESILRLVDSEIAGDALDAAGELAAIRRGWQQAPR